jgi:hypothetical protein
MQTSSTKSRYLLKSIINTVEQILEKTENTSTGDKIIPETRTWGYLLLGNGAANLHMRQKVWKH